MRDAMQQPSHVKIVYIQGILGHRLFMHKYHNIRFYNCEQQGKHFVKRLFETEKPSCALLVNCHEPAITV